MITWSRVNKDGTEEIIKEFDSFDAAEKYFKNMKDPDEEEKPDDGCWNCMNFDWRREACAANWNNMDESYYNPDTDDRELTDYCEYHETDPDADPECLKMGGNEP